MNPVQAVRSCLRQYAVFSGRAPRSEYWWWILSVGVVNVVLGIGFSEEISGTPADPAAVGESALNIPSVVFLVATLRIPVKVVTDSGGKLITHSGQSDHRSERSDAGVGL